MRKWGRIIAAITSMGIVLTATAVLFINRTASKAIPRSIALEGAPQSKDGSTNILLLGLDSRRDNDGNSLPSKLLRYMHVGSNSNIGGYNTNTIILIHIPANGRKAVAVSIPRDDYVNVPGWGYKKIKEAYGYAKYAEDSRLYKLGVKNPEREHRAREAGRTATIKTVSTLLDVPIDHFAEVNLIGFYDLANALGGIQVCLKNAVDDPKFSGAKFPAGLQTIYGVDALKFVRQRHGLPNGDLDRTHRQQAFIAGVITKFRTQGIFEDIGKISALLNVAKKDVIVDKGLDVLSFLPKAKALTSGKITFHTLPIEGYVMRNGQSVNLIDEAKVKNFVQDLFYPKTTDKNATPSPKPRPTSLISQANGKPVKGSGIPCVN